jgi:hypothetical protein
VSAHLPSSAVIIEEQPLSVSLTQPSPAGQRLHLNGGQIRLGGDCNPANVPAAGAPAPAPNLEGAAGLRPRGQLWLVAALRQPGGHVVRRGRKHRQQPGVLRVDGLHISDPEQVAAPVNAVKPALDDDGQEAETAKANQRALSRQGHAGSL